MSGGSLNYLYCKDPEELFGYIGELETVEDCLLRLEYRDIARDVRRLIEYIKSAYVRIDVLSEQLKDVFHAVEWCESCDYSEEDLIKHLDKYREGKVEENVVLPQAVRKKIREKFGLKRKEGL